MSRTYRNRSFKIVADKSDALYWLSFKTEKQVMKMIWKLYTDSHSGDYNTAKSIRKMVEKIRRAKNKQEVYRVSKDLDYIPNILPCNGKDDQSAYLS